MGVITIGAVALLLWLHWPERTGAVSSGDGSSDDDRVPDASIAEVGGRRSGSQRRLGTSSDRLGAFDVGHRVDGACFIEYASDEQFI